MVILEKCLKSFENLFQDLRKAADTKDIEIGRSRSVRGSLFTGFSHRQEMTFHMEKCTSTPSNCVLPLFYLMFHRSFRSSVILSENEINYTP